MCPEYHPSDRQPLCLCHPGGLMCPSLDERTVHCTARYEACPLYTARLAGTRPATRAGSIVLRTGTYEVVRRLEPSWEGGR
jgi:hypothetical protein